VKSNTRRLEIARQQRGIAGTQYPFAQQQPISDKPLPPTAAQQQAEEARRRQAKKRK